MAPNQRFSQGLHKPLQLLQSWSPFGEITTYLLDQRWSWCSPLSFPYFCMPVNHGPSLLSWRKERRLLRWDATGGYWTFHIRTMLPMRRFAKKIQAAIGEYDELLALVKKRKLRWFGHVSRSSGLAKTILQGTVKGKRKRDRQKKRWEDNIKEWTGMDFACSTRAAENRTKWKGIVANSSVGPPTTFQGYAIE